MKKLVYLDGRQAVLYHSSKMNPTLGRNFEALDPFEWLARLSDHTPDRSTAPSPSRAKAPQPDALDHLSSPGCRYRNQLYALAEGKP